MRLVKAHAYGNDFLIAYAADVPGSDLAGVAVIMETAAYLLEEPK